MEPSESNINWKKLLRQMKQGRAILLVGPETIMAETTPQKTLRVELQEYIRQDLQELFGNQELNEIVYYSDDGFFHIEDEYKSDYIYPIIQFYKNFPVLEPYKKLCQLPFNLILSLSPDQLLSKAMEELGLPHHFHFYDKKKYNKTLDQKVLDFQPSASNRLVYNIFGSTDSETSMILTYDDLFEFLQKIFQNHSLPDVVRESILDANYFVFVGFNYNSWYLKLLLRILNMHQKIKKVYGMGRPKKEEVETFFVNEFDMNFTGMSTSGFINLLYEQCSENNLLIIKEGQKDAHNIDLELKKKILTIIQAGKVHVALEFMGQLCVDDKLPEDVCSLLIQITARYHQLQMKKKKGIISNSEYAVELNRIIDDLLDSLEILN